jgi:thiamine biosynthesis protein ThiS
MFITINGERKEFSDNLNVAELLSQIGIDPRKIAVERNLQLIKRAEYDATPLNDDDEIEIVNFVGGG